MPEQTERRTNPDTGVEEIYVGSTWHPIKKKEVKNQTKDGDIAVELKIGEKTLSGHARPTTYDKSKRVGYYLFLDSSQASLRWRKSLRQRGVVEG